MKFTFTKEDLIESIREIDEYSNKTEPIFKEMEELTKDGVPDEFKKDWESLVMDRRIRKNIRYLYAKDLRVNHGIIID